MSKATRSAFRREQDRLARERQAAEQAKADKAPKLKPATVGEMLNELARR
jgi:hypothetical protein